eukprot:TRINITY_DN6674_c0_g1_i2.p1 TRINITY_DN6674_c0_g1~~TRINITY_DN6674_c0_g1_i2.p1  ORF type:complete len:181 (+),score=2.28 TRINITY_DN6674_c0_g1_i2:635-1177(+)
MKTIITRKVYIYENYYCYYENSSIQETCTISYIKPIDLVIIRYELNFNVQNEQSNLTKVKFTSPTLRVKKKTILQLNLKKENQTRQTNYTEENNANSEKIIQLIESTLISNQQDFVNKFYIKSATVSSHATIVCFDRDNMLPPKKKILQLDMCSCFKQPMFSINWKFISCIKKLQNFHVL